MIRENIVRLSALLLIAPSIFIAMQSSPVHAQQTAEYMVTFTATWDNTTHPHPTNSFPTTPHFSGLSGGTHNSNVTFWQTGQLASDGLELVAEQGNKTIFRDEVQDAIAAGTADQYLSGGGINPAPGSVTLGPFTVDSAYPNLTLISMLAPSPDWFVGVSALSLKNQSGNWINSMVIPLDPYDSGTDDGPDYRSPNDDTNPPEPIINLSGLSPFSNLPVGTFTIVRTDAPPADPVEIYISPSSPANVGFNVFDEDIAMYNGTSWSMYFDGSDVGLGGAPDLNAFHILDNGNLLLSFDAPVNLGGTLYDDSDILLFTVTSLGTVTSGTFSMYFDGSANGFSTIGEDIDAITMNAAGELVISTLGSAQIPRAPYNNLTQQDDDLARRRNSDGIWLRYFDGSDVGLTINTEDVWGAQVDSSTGVVYLTTLDTFVAPGLSGDGNDIFTCTPGILGNNTSCPLDLFWDGDIHGLSGERIDALAVLEPSVRAASVSLTTEVDPRDSVKFADEGNGYDDVEDDLEDLDDSIQLQGNEFSQDDPQPNSLLFLPLMQ